MMKINMYGLSNFFLPGGGYIQYHCIILDIFGFPQLNGKLLPQVSFLMVSDLI